MLLSTMHLYLAPYISFIDESYGFTNKQSFLYEGLLAFITHAFKSLYSLVFTEIYIIIIYDWSLGIYCITAHLTQTHPLL